MAVHLGWGPGRSRSDAAAVDRPGSVIADPDTVTRLRRPGDVARLVASVAVLVLVVTTAAALPDGTHGLNRDISGGLHRLAHALFVVVDTAASVAVIGLVVVYVVILLARRRADAANAVLGAGIAGLVMGVAVTALKHVSGGLHVALLGTGDGSTMAVNTVIVAALTGGDVGHHRRWFNRAAGAVTVLMISELALATITPVGVVVVVLAGWSFGLTARLALGASSRRFSADEVRGALEAVGLEVVGVAEQPNPGPQLFAVSVAEGAAVTVQAVGPDVQAVGLARRIWSVVRLRTATTGRLPVTTRGRMEHVALATYLAGGAEIPVGQVVLLAELEDGAVLLARRQLAGERLTEGDRNDAVLEGAFRTLRKLHNVGVAHRLLDNDQLLVVGDEVGFRDYANAVVAAADTVRRIDVAQLLVTLGEHFGAKRAVVAMRAGYGYGNGEDDGDGDERVLAATLQPLALAPFGRRAARGARPTMTELRDELVGAEQVQEVPEVRLERVRIRSVVSAIAVTFAAYLLIGQLSSINLVDTLRHANPAWMAVAVAASGLTYLWAAVNLDVFTPVHLRLLLTTAVEVATAFVGFVAPPSVGSVTVNVRYLGRSGLDGATAGACIAVSQVVSVVTTVCLLLILGVLTGTGTHIKVLPGPRLLAVLGGAIAVAALFAAIPPVRRRVVNEVWPRLRAAWPRLLTVLSNPWRLAAGVGAGVLLSVTYSAAMVASLYAVGAHPPILATAAVYLTGNSVGAAAPIPGGIGAVEAVLAAGLTAIGIPGHQAVPAVLIFRVATFWLPILPGWISFTLLQRRNMI